MRIVKTLLIFTAFIAASAAYAEDTDEIPGWSGDGTAEDQAGAADEGAMTSTAESPDAINAINDQAIAFKPAVGTLIYDDNTDSTTARAALGLLIDGNLARVLPENLKALYPAIQTGVIWSHLGSTGSNFFGTDSDSATTAAGANMLIIPVNLEIGTNLGPVRTAVHGGGNVIYRSVANSIPLGDGSASSDSDWNIYPNVGISFDMALSKDVGLTIRPDYTFTPGSNLLTGMLGVLINLG